MKNIKQFLAATLAVLCLAVAGCTKEDSGSVSDNAGSGNTGGGGGSSQFDGKRLVKILYQRHEVETENGVVVKDTTYWDGHYMMYVWENERLSYWTDDRDDTYTITYNDQGKPSNVTYNGGNLIEGQYTYDEQGKLVLWRKYRNGELRDEYHITCNEAGKMIEYTDDDQRITFEWDNGNIIRMMRYNNGSLVGTITYEYDNIRNLYLGFPLLITDGSISWMSQNNIVSNSTSDEDNTEWHYTYQGDYVLTKKVTSHGHRQNGEIINETTEYYEYDDGTGHIDR